uniref:4-ketoreductase n=1 Tax=Micromonospora griseorubida TaxID=28040 RepID=Q83WF3_MICGR|nr:4-ketoreductase [Micromonospora griseorubida]
MTRDRWANRSVVVTGALGFIGSHFVEELAARGADVLGLYRSEHRAVRDELSAHDRVRLLPVDLLDERRLRQVFEHEASGAQTIVHCAALDGNAAYKRAHSAEILDANLRVASNLLNCVRDFGVEDVTVLSSAEAYCGPTASPAREDDARCRTVRSGENGYVLSKLITEILAEQYRRQYGFGVHLVRPANVYGPRDSFDGPASRVIPAMIARAESGGEIEIWGDGQQTRSFVYVTDLVRAALALVETGKFHSLNVTTDETVSMLDLARVVFSVTGRTARIHHKPAQPVGAPGAVLDTTRMREVVDYTPRTLREGLEETVRWYRHRIGR